MLQKNAGLILFVTFRSVFVTKVGQGLYSLSGKTSYPRSREVSKPRDSGLNFSNRSGIALKFDRYLGSTAAEVPVKFQSDTTIATSILAASWLHEIWW